MTTQFRPTRSILALAITVLLTGCAGAASAPTSAPVAPAMPVAQAMSALQAVSTTSTVPAPSRLSVALASAQENDAATGSIQSAGVQDLPGADARAEVAEFIARLETDPNDSEALLAWDSRPISWRETADPAEYARAEEAFGRVLAGHPENVDALIGMGTIALARHAFAGALALGEQARDLAPRSARTWGVIADALVELGRYPEAVDAVQTMVDLRPDLDSYARVSYLRELHGRLDGAIEAMEAAVQAGGPAVENTEYLRVVLGNLWFLAGDLDRADATYAESLDRSQDYVFALAGRARVDAARGDLAAATDGWQAAADRVPLPEFLIGLGETQEAAGLTADAATTCQLVRDIGALFTANGVQTELEMALSEAEHGDPAHAVELGRAAWAGTPNVKAADASAWALYHAGELDEARSMAEQALALGSVEPSYAFHAGMIAAAEGDAPAARLWLGRSIDANPAWSPLFAPRAAAALTALGDGPVAGPMTTEVSR